MTNSRSHLRGLKLRSLFHCLTYHLCSVLEDKKGLESGHPWWPHGVQRSPSLLHPGVPGVTWTEQTDDCKQSCLLSLPLLPSAETQQGFDIWVSFGAPSDPAILSVLLAFLHCHLREEIKSHVGFLACYIESHPDYSVTSHSLPHPPLNILC